MKLRWVEAINFRKFVEPVRVTGIGDGINVLVGRNEMGKSTLLEAIKGVVFEKARSQTQLVRSFRHYVHGTVPEVSLGFEIGGATWTLKKRFAGSAGKAFLENSEGRRFEDEEAEAELQRLLGFSVNGRTTEPGIWGTLWVRQGHSFGDASLDERARRTLQGCLEAQVGAVTGGLRGQRIPEAVERELLDLVSTRGPRGRFKDAKDELSAAEVKAAELDAKKERLFEQMQRLARLKRDLWNLDADWSEEENRLEIEAARAKQRKAEMKAEEIKTARSEATLAHERAERAATDVETRATLLAQIATTGTAVAGITRGVAAAEAKRDGANKAHAELERAVRQVEDRERQTVDIGRRLQRVRNIVLLNVEIERLEVVVCQVEAKQKDAEDLGEKIGRISATPVMVAKIEQAEVDLAAATAALNAVATTVTFALEKAAVGLVTFDGEPIHDATATRQVIEEATIGVPGVGEVSVQPRVKNTGEVLKDIERAKRGRAAALESAHESTLAEARAASAQRRQLEQRLEGLREELGRLAPGDKKSALEPGVEALKVRIEELRGRRSVEMAALHLKDAPDQATIEKQLRENAEDAERITSDVEVAKACLSGPQKALVEAIEAYEALRRELAAEQRNLDTMTAALAAAREETSDETLSANAVELKKIANGSQAAMAAIEQDSGESIEDIRARIQRLENAANTHREQTSKLRTEIAQLSGIITASEGDGVEEAFAAAQAEQVRLQAQVRRYEEEVAVLEMLRDALRTAETEAKARYLAPVVTRVEPYLRMLLPGADIVLDEEFRVTGVKRNALEEGFSALSGGTQEQLAVLTRLAFAELLLDQGRPATVILDDALVFSDDDRIERMFDILTRAAERTQIIILTCRKRLFTRLGANMLQIEGDQ